jgi:hypothetical protein
LGVIFVEFEKYIFQTPIPKKIKKPSIHDHLFQPQAIPDFVAKELLEHFNHCACGCENEITSEYDCGCQWHIGPVTIEQMKDAISKYLMTLDDNHTDRKIVIKEPCDWNNCALTDTAPVDEILDVLVDQLKSKK